MSTSLAMEVVEITPEMAKRILEDPERPRNRPIRPKEVEKIVSAMESNRFFGQNGETIVLTAPITEGGKLLDGQHRLKAIEITGKPQQLIAMYGVDTEAFPFMGQGRKRSVQDYLAIHEIADPANVAAAVGQMIVWEGHNTFEPRKADYYARPEEVLNWIEEHPHILDSVKRAHSIRDWGLAVSTLAALHYLFTGVDKEDAETFFIRLKYGIDLEEDDPILVLRERLHAISTQRRRIPRDEFAAIVIKAWNAFRSGEKVKQLTWRGGGGRPEKMPEIL